MASGVEASPATCPKPRRSSSFLGGAAPGRDLFGQQAPGVAWKTKPSWDIVANDDRTVNPDLERFAAKRMGATTYDVDSSHVPILSPPQFVLDVIRDADQGAGTVTADALPAVRGQPRTAWTASLRPLFPDAVACVRAVLVLAGARPRGTVVLAFPPLTRPWARTTPSAPVPAYRPACIGRLGARHYRRYNAQSAGGVRYGEPRANLRTRSDRAADR